MKRGTCDNKIEDWKWNLKLKSFVLWPNYPACELHFRKETCNSTEHLNGLEL